MFKFISFEWKYWLRTPMLWIFLLVNTLLIFGAVSSEQITIGGGVGNVHKNAPLVVQQYYMVMSLFGLLMTTAFMTAAANRDFSSGMYQFVFTSPIKKRDYFFGKFLGAASIAVIPLLGVSLGALLGPLMPWVEPERYGEVVWAGHWQGILAFALPNTLITAVLVYGLAILFRSNLVSFIGAMLILVLYVVSQGYTRDLDKEWLANLLDPFGAQPLSIAAKYLTVEEKNRSAVPLAGDFLRNRLLWLGLASLLLTLLYSRFSFSLRAGGAAKPVEKKKEEGPGPALEGVRAFPAPARSGFSMTAFLQITWFEAKSILKNQTFLIIVAIGVINLIANLSSFSDTYGSTQYPVTYDVIERIRGSFYLFLIAIVTFYSGALVWKERDAKIAAIEDATSVSTGALFASKLLALLAALFSVLCATILVGMAFQALNGYTRFELGQYAVSLLVLDLLEFSFLAIVAILIQYLVNNRYLAYFVFIAFVVVDSFLWSALKISTNMLGYGSRPFLVYSDMNGFGPFVPGQVAFNVYWGLVALLFCFLAYAFYLRGAEDALAVRVRTALQRLRQKAVPLAVLGILFTACAGFVFYQTEVLNTNISQDEYEKRQKSYELTYKKYEGIAQPVWTDLDFHIALYPYQRHLYASTHAQLVNRSGKTVRELHFTLPSDIDSLRISIPGATLKKDDQRLNYRIYALARPMQPGDTLAIRLRATKESKGIENEVSFTSLTQNGTFFNNSDFMPILGYVRDYEIRNKNRRKKLGLPARKRLPELDDNNLAARSKSYIGLDADYVQVRTTISTASDQIAVAPGSLQKSWQKDGRRYFQYKLDHASLNFFSFISARYEVAREKWKGIDVEVYHIKEHAYNVPNMLASIKKSLEYYTTHFGPYYHKQCRIIEFPRYASFAQAFPGTMPYSEGIGFITDLRDVKEDDIDFVFFVVAHEMAHQYWAHQLIGANMRGSEMLSESFAEYSALMVMEKEYGKDKMRKFLSYEMDRYLSGRGGELEAERPLMATENQSYIHYNKGSVVLYYLKEMIGEKEVNAALQELLQEYAYKTAPYPTSIAAVRAFRRHTPDSLQYLIGDLFEHITLFSNRVTDASYRAVGSEYEVRISTQSEKFRADSLGRETPRPLNDYLDLGVFADSGSKKTLGKALVLQRVKITQSENTFTFRVKEKPAQAGIDPYHYLVDRIPDDNVKKVEQKE
ncbi:MAG: M1 family aminopeptidase [Saprospiraceae bacterium]